MEKGLSFIRCENEKRTEKTKRREKRKSTLTPSICHVNPHIIGSPNNITINLGKQIRKRHKTRGRMDFDMAKKRINSTKCFVCANIHIICFFESVYNMHSSIFRPNETRKKKTTGNSSNSFRISFFPCSNGNYLLHDQSRVRIVISACNLMYKFKRTTESVCFFSSFSCDSLLCFFGFCFVVDFFFSHSSHNNAANELVLEWSELPMCVWERVSVQWRNETRQNLIDECRILGCRTKM